jgi:hypothetical protein
MFSPRLNLLVPQSGPSSLRFDLALANPDVEDLDGVAARFLLEGDMFGLPAMAVCLRRGVVKA